MISKPTVQTSASLALLLPLLAAGCSSGTHDATPGGGDASVGQGVGVTDAGLATGDACSAPAHGQVTLPADDAVHDAGVEWWYWTGHLQGPDGGWFGFEEVFFSFNQGGVQAQMVQSALTDVGAGTFQHAVSEGIGAPANTPNGFNLTLNGVTALGGGGHDQLHALPGDASVDLTLDQAKPALLEYGTGYKTYSDGDTYYYSRPLLHAQGTITRGAETIPVTGQAWFDHQWGNLAKVVNDGWEWFGIQLDDGREMMINVPLTNGAPGAGAAEGTLMTPGCATVVLKPGDVTVTSSGTWTSPDSKCTYPMGWHVTTGDIDVTITPLVADQELPDSQPIYWEGASSVSGTVSGRAYVELNGFCH
jgi:predicted secreted hydrolase